MCVVYDDSLITIARDAVSRFPASDVDVAFAFCQAAVPSFSAWASTDRLVKVGRLVTSLVRENDAQLLLPGLKLVVQECEILASQQDLRVPTRQFGKTNLAMPIVTLGCMRFQQNWGTKIKTMNEIDGDCQDNLVAILRQAFAYGMTHIETARGYGTSELQLGVALQHLMAMGEIRREDFILQTKVPALADPAMFRTSLETSFKNLQVEYVDLFAFHGMNFEEQYDWVFGAGGNCMDVIQEYVAAGKIRHVGFSTHGATDFILKLINTDAFDYVNLHYHYFGSYTASGGGHDGNGNLDCVKLLAEKNMGCFIISPFDKGGALYAPSKKLRSLTLPDMEPIMFKSLWLWNHHQLNEGYPQCHTYTAGAARPSDLDQPAVAAHLYATHPDNLLRQTRDVVGRLDKAREEALGTDWVKTWWQGLPKSSASAFQVEHNQIIWLYNVIKAFGMRDFARNRYASFEGNESKWDESLPTKENIWKKVGVFGWGFGECICL